MSPSKSVLLVVVLLLLSYSPVSGHNNSNDHPPIGGRLPGTNSCPLCLTEDGDNDPKCHINGHCICRYQSEICYSDSPPLFNFFFVSLLLLFSYHSIFGVVFLLDMFNTHDTKKKGLNAMDKVCLMASVGSIIRLLWIVLAFNGINGSVYQGGPVLKGFILKVPQILWMGAFFFISLVWRDLEDQLVNMKRAVSMTIASDDNQCCFRQNRGRPLLPTPI
jgi:hypothetical protein